MGAPAKTVSSKEATGKVMIRVVVDTNILVSVALPESRLQILADGWQKRRFRLLISAEIFDEYLRVLTYPKFNLSSADIKRILEKELLPYTEMVKVTTQVNVIVKDPSDNKFLACAVDGHANFIVSGDQHLLSVGQFHHIPILTARQLLEKLSS